MKHRPTVGELVRKLDKLIGRAVSGVQSQTQSSEGRRVQLVTALNVAAAQVQQSATTVEDVFHAATSQFAALGLRGGISSLEDDGRHLVVRATGVPRSELLEALQDLVGVSILGYRFRVDQVDVYRRVIEGGSAVFEADASRVVEQLLPSWLTAVADKIGKLFPARAGIFAPLRCGGDTRGVLAVSGAGLLAGDVAAVQAFANHISVACDKAELIAQLKETNEQLRADIVARNTAERALRQSEERFSRLARCAPDAIVTLDEHQRVSFWNEGAVRVFGYSSEEASGALLCSLIVPERDRVKVGGSMSSYATTGEKPQGDHPFPFTAIRQDGIELLAELSLSRVQHGEHWHVIAIIRDVTEWRRLEQELQRVEKLESLGLLAGGIAHDFNNLLTVLTGRLSLAERAAVDETQRHHFAEAARASEQASGLTRQLLTFARGGAPVRTAASIADLIRESAEFVLRGSNVRVRFELPSELWAVHVDVGQMSQVINNLIINADQAMPDGGELEVRAENVALSDGQVGTLPAGRYVCVRVEDRGAGIDPAIQKTVFDPFFTTKEQGSGLGLATTYSIVKRHGGHISLSSHLGRGTTVTVYVEADDTSPALPHRATESAPKGDERILVLDDEPAVRAAVARMLEGLGYSVVSAESAAQAVSLFEHAQGSDEPIALAIVDLTIPGGIGGEVALTSLRSIDPKLPAIVASGYANSQVLADYRSYGFQAVLMKPFGIDALGRAVRAALEVPL